MTKEQQKNKKNAQQQGVTSQEVVNVVLPTEQAEPVASVQRKEIQ
jgi:hypothetical protein